MKKLRRILLRLGIAVLVVFVILIIVHYSLIRIFLSKEWKNVEIQDPGGTTYVLDEEAIDELKDMLSGQNYTFPWKGNDRYGYGVIITVDEEKLFIVLRDYYVLMIGGLEIPYRVSGDITNAEIYDLIRGMD